MSITAKLDVFTLKIREKGSKENYLNFNDIGGFKIIEEISLYLAKNIYLFKIDKKAERTSRIEKNELSENSLFCRIKIGKFGESSEIVDTLSGSGIFHKEREHSDTIPLFFHMKMQNSGNEAIVHVEKFNNRSLIPEIRNILSTVLENLRENLFIYELKPLKHSITLKDFIRDGHGSINKINLILDINRNNDYLEPIILTIKSKHRKEFPKNILDMIIDSSINRNPALLKELLPQKIQRLSIGDAVIELKSKDRGNIKVHINESINVTNSFSIITPPKSQDKFGHPSYKYLKSFSESKMK